MIAESKVPRQQLWLLKLEWNKNLPAHISQQWKNFIRTLPELESIKEVRCFLKVGVNVESVVLNGFADVFSRAYGTVIYTQTVSITNEITSQLFFVKPIFLQ